MNKLTKKQTTPLYLDQTNGYNDLKSYWSQLVNDKTACKDLTAADHMLYAILRGKDWRKCFTFATNTKKLENGLNPYATITKALNRVRNEYWFKNISVFKDHVSSDAFEIITKSYLSNYYNTHEDAYIVKEETLTNVAA